VTVFICPSQWNEHYDELLSSRDTIMETQHAS